ncbi:MAG: hypothetical protein AAGB14_13310, partial [Verrucomicrobiota bacterium]
VKILLYSSLASFFLIAPSAFGLATEHIGPNPEGNHPQPGWPSGIVELMKHESRVYSRWVNGNEQFYYKTEPEAVQTLIDAFSRVRLRDHILRITTDHPEQKTFDGNVVDYNVNLSLLDGIALWHARGKAQPSTHEPVLTIHASDRDADWIDRLQLPAHLILENNLPGSSLKGTAPLPNRNAWHALIQFKDGSPAVDFEGGVKTSLSYWDDDSQTPIRVGEVNHKGRVHLALSEAEIQQITEGKIWLTLTVGNYLDKPRSDHPRLPFEALSRDPELAEAFLIERPRYYYGRIVFEDGTPAGGSRDQPWPGASVSVSFAYAGKPDLDEDGYFRVSFGPDQYDALLKRKPRKNIYVPLEEKGRSRALHIFPAEKLSSHRKTAGVVKIPRPAYFPEG